MTHYFAAISVPFDLVKEKITASSLHYELSTHYKVIPHPDDLHITLLFFGALNHTQLEFVKQEMHAIATNTDAFTIALNGVSSFGNPAGPRVVYLSAQPTLLLTELYQQLSKRLKSVLQKPASTAYTPHVTIAKKKKDNCSVPIEQEHFEPLTLDVSAMILYSITPTESPKYSPESTFSFVHSSRIVD
ncbi:RNA 2',3'-cyclic phosphodiesterase [Sporosarcina sp. BI001-red]|uniref:RNA 2',3'-cyclic phosphodiesterase n=1 Tax=Sporosarcina sp. BI001-red TaxID=2282866 RepID=UPI000E254503|nr:RNA 2',3'-cyclic phosphodiesterase [Sporosarcina sp. BI001-red]REB06440.1 RNA 2',3'-cyclic phosphodiesterase [Sporosarcina sp. BI001-red]